MFYILKAISNILLIDITTPLKHHQMNKLFIFSGIILIIFSSCTFYSSGTWKNDNIEQNLKNKMEGLDANILEFLYQKDMENLKKMYSEVLLDYEEEHKFTQTIADFSSVIKSEERQIIDQFHTVNDKENVTTIQPGDHYKFGYKALNKETYASIFKIEGKYNSSYLVGVIYGKYDDDWKINVLRIGEYSLDGKNAETLYKISQRQYKKGHFVDAVNNMYLANQLMKPIKDYWTYNNHDEMESYFNNINKEIEDNFTFPIEVESIPSKPVILGVSPQLYEQGIIPIISYKSEINLNDSIRLRNEYLKLHDGIEDVFKGLKRENKHLIYKAFEEIPDGVKQVRSYTFVHER